MDIADVRRRLMLSIAGTLAACGPTVLPDGDAGGSGVGSSEGGSGATTSDATTSAATTTQATTTVDATTVGADDASDDVMTFDVGGPPPVECEPQPMPPLEECMAPLPDGAEFFQFYCVTPPAGESCEAWAASFDSTTANAIEQCLPTEDGCWGTFIIDIGCGPLPNLGDQCCSWFAATLGQICPGRPFVVAGRERLAELVDRDDWAADVALEAGTSEPTHAAIAAAWAEQARFEHASIASFSRFILQLLAHGAPARLLTAAQVALGEEIEHARLFFGFASRYAGRVMGPAVLATHDALAAGEGFDEVVLATVREGCIAETISAWHVSIAAGSAREPAMARALSEVAEQELRHATLAWSVLAWALPRASASLRRRIEATLHDAAAHAPRGPTLAATLDDAQWLAHGILPERVHAAAARQALRELVAPAARSLMSAVAARPNAAASAGVV